MSNQPIITHEDGATTIDCGDLGYAVIPYEQPTKAEVMRLCQSILETVTDGRT